MPERMSASVVKRHMACHGSANLEEAILNWTPPVEDRTADNAANRGTKKHELLEPIMELPAKDILGMAKYLQYVGELRSQRRFKVLVEAEVQAKWLVTQPQTTADLVLYTQDELHIVDGKWGKIKVDVLNNDQLMYYAVCFAPLAPKAKGVRLHILQPPLDNFESTWVSATELTEWMEKAQQAEKQIQAGDLTLTPGDHCQFCPANPHSRGQKGKPLCPVMMKLLYPGQVDEDEILSM